MTLKGNMEVVGKASQHPGDVSFPSSLLPPTKVTSSCFRGQRPTRGAAKHLHLPEALFSYLFDFLTHCCCSAVSHSLLSLLSGSLGGSCLCPSFSGIPHSLSLSLGLLLCSCLTLLGSPPLLLPTPKPCSCLGEGNTQLCVTFYTQLL